MKPIVGITMGDAAGIGPEVIAKALAHREVYDVCSPLVVGDASVMKNALKIVKKNLNVQSVDDPAKGKYQHGTIDVLDLHNIDASKLQIGKVQQMAGKAALEYIETAVKLAQQNKINALCTASINKEAIRVGRSKGSRAHRDSCESHQHKGSHNAADLRKHTRLSRYDTCAAQ